MRNNLLYLVLVALLFSSCSSTKWLKGSWGGTGYQIDGHTWEVALDATDQADIKIDYPSLSCSGEWTILQSEKDFILLKENITTGVDRCDQGNEVEVTRINKNEINVEFYLRWFNPDKPIATARLKKNNNDLYLHYPGQVGN